MNRARSAAHARGRSNGPSEGASPLMLLLLAIACADPEVGIRSPGAPAAPIDTAPTRPGDPPDDTAPSEPSEPSAPCPADMALVETVCMDRYEAPNVAGAGPLVMYTFLEAEDWCAHRGKRLCTDAEWKTACDGGSGTAYPYGDTHQPGVCNDEEIWRVYSQTRLNGWPSGASVPEVASVAELLDGARALGAVDAADHVEELYQGEGGGDNLGCVNAYGVYDLVGNAEEWTRRSDGGATSFHGNLKGRYWAESRTCQSDVTVHGDTFRFYEIGFRCCAEPS